MATRVFMPPPSHTRSLYPKSPRGNLRVDDRSLPANMDSGRSGKKCDILEKLPGRHDDFLCAGSLRTTSSGHGTEIPTYVYAIVVKSATAMTSAGKSTAAVYFSFPATEL